MARNNYPVELFSASGTIRLRPKRETISAITGAKPVIAVGSRSTEKVDSQNKLLKVSHQPPDQLQQVYSTHP